MRIGSKLHDGHQERKRDRDDAAGHRDGVDIGAHIARGLVDAYPRDNDVLQVVDRGDREQPVGHVRFETGEQSPGERMVIHGTNERGEQRFRITGFDVSIRCQPRQAVFDDAAGVFIQGRKKQRFFCPRSTRTAPSRSPVRREQYR